MRFLVIAAILLACSFSMAADYSDTVYSNFKNVVYGSAGFTEGGFGLGADYEYAYHRTYGLGGFARFMNEDDTKASGRGIFAFGAFIRPHFHRRAWDFYVSPGFAVSQIDLGSNDETALGPSLAIGLVYQYSRKVAFGVENLRLYGWFADDFKGLIVDELSAKVRWGF